MKVREISLLAIIAALYSTLVIVLAPISFGPVQIRVADCLIPLSAILGWPAILGVALGALISNAYYWLGPLDVILGPVANLIAASLIFFLRKRLFTVCLAGSIAVGVIVGSYLWVYFPPPEFGVVNLPLWAAMVLSITISSIISIAVIGYALLKALVSYGFR